MQKTGWHFNWIIVYEEHAVIEKCENKDPIINLPAALALAVIEGAVNKQGKGIRECKIAINIVEKQLNRQAWLVHPKMPDLHVNKIKIIQLSHGRHKNEQL